MKKRTNNKVAKAVMLITKSMATAGGYSASTWYFCQPKAPKNPYKVR